MSLNLVLFPFTLFLRGCQSQFRSKVAEDKPAKSGAPNGVTAPSLVITLAQGQRPHSNLSPSLPINVQRDGLDMRDCLFHVKSSQYRTAI